MEEKINIAEILKDCPKGMELDCTMYNGVVTLEQVQPLHTYSIKIRVKCGDESFTNVLTEYGQTSPSPCNKCVIFPKGKTTWEGFQKPFKDGDILFVESFCSWILIYKENKDKKNIYKYVAVSPDTPDFLIFTNDYSPICCKESISEIRFATEYEKQKLFDVIKANGYRWNDETKTLEILIKPKFKIGDRIRHKLNGNVYEVSSFLSNGCGGGVYEVDVINEMTGKIIDIKEQDNYELLPNKFDTNDLKPFETRLLVRNADGDLWIPALYTSSDSKGCYVLIYRDQCIPYEGNEHLLNTKDDCDDFYKTW